MKSARLALGALVVGAALLSGCTGNIGYPQNASQADSSDLGGTGEQCSAAGPAPYGGASLTLTDVQLRNSVEALFPFELAMPVLPERGRSKHGFSTSPVNNTLSFNHIGIMADAAEELAIQSLDRLDEVLPCSLEADADGCVHAFIDEFGRRAFRRPLEGDEHDGMFALYETLVADAVDPPLATVAIIAAMLQSPQFLYQLDIGEALEDREVHQLTSHEVASHIAYLITDAPPDAELRELADADGLQDRDVITAQARRLLDTPAGHTMVKRFVGEWFGIQSRDYSGRVSPELASAMVEEVERDLEAWIFGGDEWPVSGLLTESTTFVNQPLAEHYGLDGANSSSAEDWQEVELPAHYQGGLLTKALVSTAYSNLEDPSVILRGVMVLQRLLCYRLGTPPNNAVDLNPTLPPGSLPREKVEARGDMALCATCHSNIDPIGLGMEELDQLGRFRTSYDGGEAVDNMGSLALFGVDSFTGTAELGQALAETQEFRDCATQQWAHYAFGNEESGASCPAEEGADTPQDFREMVLGIVGTDTYLQRQRDGETESP